MRLKKTVTIPPKTYATISRFVYLLMCRGFSLQRMEALTGQDRDSFKKLIESEVFKQQMVIFLSLKSIYEIDNDSEMINNFESFIDWLQKYGLVFFHSDKHNKREIFYHETKKDKGWFLRDFDENFDLKLVYCSNRKKIYDKSKKPFFDMVRDNQKIMKKCGFYYDYKSNIIYENKEHIYCHAPIVWSDYIITNYTPQLPKTA